MTGVKSRPMRMALLGLGAVGLGGLIVLLPATVAFAAPTVVAALLLPPIVGVLTRSDPDPASRRRVLNWTVAAFVTHLALGLAITYLPNPLSLFRSDAATYHIGAIGVARHWIVGEALPIFPGGKEGFYYVLGALYWVFGFHPVAGLVFNALLSAAMVPVLTDTTRRLFGERAARFVPPLVVLLPGVLLWTSQLLKEAGAAFLIAVVANCAVRLTERVAPATLVVLAAAVSFLFAFRGPIGLVVAAGVVGGIVFARREIISGIGIALSAVSLMAITVFAVGVGLSGYRGAVGTDLADANVVRQDLAASASSGFDVNADISTPKRAITYLPFGLVSLVFGPFPWQVRNLTQAMALPDVFVWWWLLPSVWRGFRNAGRIASRRAVVAGFPVFLAAVILALAIGNFGTLVRERVQLVVLAVPFIALGLALRPKARSAMAPSDEVGAIPPVALHAVAATGGDGQVTPFRY